MKKGIFLILFIVSTYFCNAQYTFERNYYLDGYEPYNISPGAINSSDSGYYVVSFSGDTNSAKNSSINLTRLNKEGEVLWSKNSDFYTLVYDYGLGELIQYPDSSLVMLWNDQDALNAYTRTGFAHVDKNGNAIWGKKYNTPSYLGDIYINSFARTPDNGLIGAGEVADYNTGLTWIFFLKADSAGNLLWCKQYFLDSSSGFNTVEATRITSASDSGFLYAFAASDSITSTWYGYLMKTDANGNVEWAKRYSPNIGAPIFTKPEISDQNIYIAETYSLFTNIEIFKTDMQGIPVWNYAYTGMDMNNFYDGETDANGNTMLSGLTNDTLGYIFEIDSSGNILWSYKYGKPDTAYLTNLLNTQDGGVLGYGYGPAYSKTIPNQSIVSFVKTDQWGNDGCEQPFPVTKTALPLVYSDVHIKAYPVAMTQLDTILNFHDAPMDTTTLCAVRNVTSVKAIASTESNVEVYPNPANDILSIKSSDIGICYFYLYDGLGNLVQKTELKNDFTILSLTRLAVGMYYYRILDTDMKAIRSDKLLIIR